MAHNEKKTEHAFQTFGKDIKNCDFPEVLFLCGVEEYLVKWACNALVKRYINDSAMALDLIKMSGSEGQVSEILEACDTFAILSERKVVWVDDFPPLKAVNPKGYSADRLRELLDYMANPNPNTLLIFSAGSPEEKSDFTKQAKKICRVYDFDKLSYAQLVAFAEKRFKSEQIQIKRNVMKYLIDQTGYFNKETDYHIYNFENDIKKIIAHSDGKTIQESDISETLNGDLDTFVFNFLDSVCNNRKDSAFRLLYNILKDGTDIYNIIGLLINHFELILEVKEFREEGLNLAQICKTLGAHEFRIKKAMAFADRFNVNHLKSILSQLYETDRNIKTGIMDGALCLELLIGRI